MGGLGAAYYLATKGINTTQAIRNIEFSNPKIKIGKVGFGSIELQMTMDFLNNSSQNISMEYFQGYVNYQGNTLSSFTFDGKGKNIVLNARATTNVPFTVVVKNYAALQTIAKVIKAIKYKQSINTVINIDSRFYAAGFDVPVVFDWDLRTNSLVSTPVAKRVSGIGSVNTMGTFYFGNGEDINSLDDLRKKFYKLSKKYHPDAGGSTSEFQQLQQEYETLKYRVYTNNNFTKEEVDTEVELDKVLNAIYHQIMNIPGIVIEVAGKWLWIGGNTYPVKDQLKAAGLKFASTKKMWYFAGTEYRGKGETMEMDNIRKKYGSQILKSNAHYLSGTGDNLVMLLERIKFLLHVRKGTRRKKYSFSKN